MDAPVGTLPDRPLGREEVQRFEEFGAIDGVFPVLGKAPGTRDEAHGVTISAEGTLYALAFDGSEWVQLDDASLEHQPPEGAESAGIHFADRPKLDALQETIREFLESGQ